MGWRVSISPRRHRTVPAIDVDTDAHAGAANVLAIGRPETGRLGLRGPAASSGIVCWPAASGGEHTGLAPSHWSLTLPCSRASRSCATTRPMPGCRTNPVPVYVTGGVPGGCRAGQAFACPVCMQVPQQRSDDRTGFLWSRTLRAASTERCQTRKRMRGPGARVSLVPDCMGRSDTAQHGCPTGGMPCCQGHKPGRRHN